MRKKLVILSLYLFISVSSVFAGKAILGVPFISGLFDYDLEAFMKDWKKEYPDNPVYRVGKKLGLGVWKEENPCD